MQDLKIGQNIIIPQRELKVTFSRSKGPGGQNVNKVNTKVTLYFNVEHSEALTQEQKRRIKQKLASRMSRNGVLILSASNHRSQHANRETALRRLSDLLTGALKVQPVRKKTKIPGKAHKKRLKAKKHRSKIKALRSKGFLTD